MLGLTELCRINIQPMIHRYSLSAVFFLISLTGLFAQGTDDCAGAVPVVLNVGTPITFIGDNTAATSTNDFDPGSPFFGAPVMWHSFTTSECAHVTASFCGLSPAWGNVFGILATDCPADSVIFFSTFNTTDCGDGNYTYFFFDLAAGTYNLPVVLDPGNGSEGPYSIDLSAAACAIAINNDDCSQVVPEALAVGASLIFTGDNTTATSANDFDPGSPFFGSPVVWHAFTTTECADVRFSFCGQTPTWENVFGILATDCPADSLIFFSTYNTTDCGDGNYTYFFNGLAAGTYNLPVVYDPLNNSVGPYGIEVSATACVVVADNDDCSQVVPEALAVGVPLIFNGDNTTATADNDFDPGSPFFGAPVVWHAFTTSECTNVTISYCGLNPAWGNVFGILATDCPADSILFFSTYNTTDCGDGNFTYFFDDLAAGTYNLPVVLDAFNGSEGPYSIVVIADECLVVLNNDDCSTILPEILALGGSVTFTGDNSTATSNNDFVPGSPFDGAPVMWHSFTTTECTDVSVSYCGLTPAWGNVFGILATDCPADSLVFFTTYDDTTCGDGNFTYYFDELAAGTYNLPVVLDPLNNSVGPYSILVSADTCLSTSITAASVNEWLVYPNPASEFLQVIPGRSAQNLNIELCDALGRTVMNWTRAVNAGVPITIALPQGLPGGSYTIRFLDPKGPHVQRIQVR